MHANKQYITVEGGERERERGGDLKAVRSTILEVESIQEVRRLPPSRPYPLRPRLQASGSAADSRRDPSPSLSAITAHEDYFREMETAILSENHNLKEHNQFLKAQIEAMFERERRFKGHLGAHRERLRQLEAVNAQLEQQLHLLITSILAEIERIQDVIEQQQDLDRSLSRHIFQTTPKSSEACASETESTIHKDLEDLKTKVKEIYNKKYVLQEAPAFHRCEYTSANNRLEELHHETFAQEAVEAGRAERGREGELQLHSVSRPKLERRGKKPKGL